MKVQDLPRVVGSSQIISEGQEALASLGDLLPSLDNGDAQVAEIAIWENTPITALISLDFETVLYGWNFTRWVEVNE